MINFKKYLEKQYGKVITLALAQVEEEGKIYLLADGKVLSQWEQPNFAGMFFAPDLSQAIEVVEEFTDAVNNGKVERATPLMDI